MHHASDDYNWNDRAVGQLRALWAEGHSTAEIGRRMGVSKNAIIGKSRRLSLPPRPSPIRAATHTQPPPIQPLPAKVPTLPPLMSEAVPVAAARPEPVMARTRPVQRQAAPERPLVSKAVSVATAGAETVMARTQTETVQRQTVLARPLGNSVCCWPIGEPGRAGFRFCDGTNAAGRPYCPDHCEIAYVKPRDRREAA